MKAWWLPELVRFWNLVYGRYGLQPRKVAFTVLLCFMKDTVPTVGETDTCAREDESDSIWPGLLPLITQSTLAKHSRCLGKLPTWCSTPPRGCRWQATRDPVCGTPEVFTALLCHFSLKEDKYFFFFHSLWRQRCTNYVFRQRQVGRNYKWETFNSSGWQDLGWSFLTLILFMFCLAQKVYEMAYKNTHTLRCSKIIKFESK